MAGQRESVLQKHGVLAAVVFTALLCFFWALAWPALAWLRQAGILPGRPAGIFLYWLAARLLIWVLPSLALLRRMGKPFGEVLGAGRWRGILLFGGGAGLIWGAKAPLYLWLTGQPLAPVTWDWSFIAAVVYVPFVEELAFRGAVLQALQAKLSFARANLVSGLLFLLAHFPGWYFEGMPGQDLAGKGAAALGILLLGWILGFVAHKSKAVAASTLAHMLNNLFQRFVP